MQHEPSRVERSPRERRAFLWAKLYSLSGIVPIGTFVVLHLCTNAQALGGQAAFDAAVARSSRLPFLVVAEVLGLWLPLAFHAVYGLKRVWRSRPELGAYPFARHWAYVGQRVTGVLTLLFIGWHLSALRVPVLLGRMNRSDYFQELCASLGSTAALGIPWFSLAFLVAMAAVAFHLANGVHGFCFSWGITVSRASSRRASAFCGLGGIVLFVVGASTILYFATGWRIGSSEPSEGAPGVSCSELSDGQRAALARTSHGAPSLPSARPGRK